MTTLQIDPTGTAESPPPAVCTAPTPSGAALARRALGSIDAGPFMVGLATALATVAAALGTLLATGLPAGMPTGLDGAPTVERPAAVTAPAPEDLLAADLSAARPLELSPGSEVGGLPPGLAGRLAAPAVPADAPTYISFVLDGSGSMLERTGAGPSKIDQAKGVVTDTINGLPLDVFAGVRLFGHRVPEAHKDESCRDSELVVPFLPGADAGRSLARTRVTPRGWTPLAENLRIAAGEFPSGANRAIVLVSDGKETCGGDPVAVARAIRAADPAIAIYTVGFGVDPEAREQLRKVADVGGGVYEDATSHAGLVDALRRISRRTTAGVAVRY
jgi:hypothetical protein